MRAASPADVLTAAGLQAGEGTLATAGAMLDISYPILESLLETSLAARSTIDSFNTSSTDGGLYRLTQAFIDSEDIAVYNAPSSTNPYSAILADYLVPATEYSINATKGVLTITPLDYYGANTLVVIYGSGFGVLDTDESVLNVPFSLAQMAISAAVLAMNIMPSTPANRKDKTVRDVSGSLYGYLAKSTAPMSRPRMSVEYPTFSALYE